MRRVSKFGAHQSCHLLTTVMCADLVSVCAYYPGVSGGGAGLVRATCARIQFRMINAFEFWGIRKISTLGFLKMEVNASQLSWTSTSC